MQQHEGRHVLWNGMCACGKHGCGQKDVPLVWEVLDRISSQAAYGSANLTRQKSRESKSYSRTTSQNGRSRFMRLINVVTVWAQCHSFKKNKNKMGPIPNMTSRLRESFQLMSRMRFLEHEVDVTIWLVQRAHA